MNRLNLISGEIPIKDLATAINRLAAAIERSCSDEELAGERHTRYTCGDGPSLITEPEMAQSLRMKSRTLANHRRQGRFPGCWIRNGRRILWLVEPTVASWQKGIG